MNDNIILFILLILLLILKYLSIEICSKFLDENFQVIRKLIEDVGNLFENANQAMVPKSHNNRYEDDDIRVRLQDMDKVNNGKIPILVCSYVSQSVIE